MTEVMNSNKTGGVGRVKKKRLALLVLLVFAFSIAVTGCGGQSGDQGDAGDAGEAEKMYIGWVGPLTGACAENGQQLKNGAELAIKEINAAGGIDGKMLELVAQDDKSDPKEAANIATRFTSDARLVAVLGNYNSSCALAGIPIYNEAKMPFIHVGTAPTFTTEHGEYDFRISVTDAFQGKFVVNWMFEEGFKNPAILYENNDYGRGLLETAKAEIKALGGTVAAEETYMLGETKDFTGILTKVKASGADSIFIGGLYNEAALIAKQMKQLKLDIPMFGTDGIFEQALIDLAGEAAEGIRVSGLLLPTDNDPKIQEFVKNYNADYGKNPGTYAAFDYDAMKLLAKAIAEVGTEPEALQAYLADMPEAFDGVTGQLRFDENHDAQRPSMKKLMVKDGTWALAE